MSILVTGAPGFIGSHVVRALISRGEHVIGVDNLNDYYSTELKRSRLQPLLDESQFEFHKCDIADHEALSRCLKNQDVTDIIHLAAQAGVRYSIENPFAYLNANLAGHLSILELARAIKPQHLVYASSSSIYGANTKTPFAETDITDQPVSLYGATKKSDELMSASYGRLYQLPQTGLRFFTVYGPQGRPDMAYWIFTEKILRGEPIQIYNQGKMSRDFSYIDDIVSGVLAALKRAPDQEQAFHQIYNLGNDHPEELMTLVTLLEKSLGKEADKEFLGMQAGDVERTWANIDKARKELGYAPKTSLAEGIDRYINWRLALENPFT